MDYRDIESKLNFFANVYGHIAANSPFRGHNFMTNWIVAQRQSDNKIWFELSYGSGMSSQYLIGITFKGSPEAEKVSGCIPVDSVSDFRKVDEVLESILTKEV